MMISKKIKRLANKVVEYNLKRDGWNIIRSIPNEPGPNDIHAVRDRSLFIVHVNPAVYPDEPSPMNNNQMEMARYLARKMQAHLYSADIIFNPDLSVKDLRYRFLRT